MFRYQFQQLCVNQGYRTLLICINSDSLKGVQIFERQIIMQIRHGRNINGLFPADGH